MTVDQKHVAAPVAKPVALELVLEQSQEVKAKVEAVAEDLAATNDLVKKNIAEGATTLSAHQALANTNAWKATCRNAPTNCMKSMKRWRRGLTISSKSKSP